MKRRTRANIGNGQWPNMRADTLKAISDELTRARKKHPKPGPHGKILRSYAEAVLQEFYDYQAGNGRGSATRIYASAAAVAAMAIRIMEEGSSGSAYKGNTQAPEFKLTVENDRAD